MQFQQSGIIGQTCVLPFPRLLVRSEQNLFQLEIQITNSIFRVFCSFFFQIDFNKYNDQEPPKIEVYCWKNLLWVNLDIWAEEEVVVSAYYEKEEERIRVTIEEIKINDFFACWFLYGFSNETSPRVSVRQGDNCGGSSQRWTFFLHLKLGETNDESTPLK